MKLRFLPIDIKPKDTYFQPVPISEYKPVGTGECNCLFDTTNKYCYYQYRDRNGTPIDKFLKVREGSKLHEQINNFSKGNLCGIVEDH